LVHTADRFFVLTGGPGSGKSSLIDALERLGYSRSVEAGRGIIQDQVDIGGSALPWADRVLFAELMLSWEMRSYRLAQEHPGAVFFDRGVLDVAGYLRLSGLRFLSTPSTQPSSFVTTAASSSPRRGRKSFTQTKNASRISKKPSAPTTP